VASSAGLRQIGGMNLHLMLNENFIWASMLWGAVGGGYLLYGWRQQATIPFVGGAAMTAASFFLPALWMSLASVAIMYAVWWLCKQGY
jgi:predicted phage tail protein